MTFEEWAETIVCPHYDGVPTIGGGPPLCCTRCARLAFTAATAAERERCARIVHRHYEEAGDEAIGFLNAEDEIRSGE